MTPPFPDLSGPPVRVLVVGDCGSDVARGLRGCGHEVEELLPSDFNVNREEMSDVVVVLPGCADALRVGAVAAAISRSVWFHDGPAPPELIELLNAAEVPLVCDRDVTAECAP